MPLQVFRTLFLDLHKLTQPHVHPGSLKQGSAFLFLEPGLNASQRAGRPRDTARFRAYPLSRHLGRDLFWKGFDGILEDARVASYWHLQLPHLLVPLASEPLAGLTAKVTKPRAAELPARVVLYAWPTGWSTNLEITPDPALLDAGNPLATLRGIGDLVGQLRREEVFRLGAEALSLAGVFKRVAATVVEDWFQQSGHAGLPPPVRSRLAVVAYAASELLTEDGGVKVDLQVQGLAPDLRSALHGALLGRRLSLDELLAREQGAKGRPRFQIVPFRAGDFGLVDFEEGSLLALSHLYASRGRHPSLCLTSNIRSCTMMFHALTASAKDAAPDAPWAEDHPSRVLGRAAKAALAVLDQYYPNRYCEALCATYGAPQAAAPGAGG